MTAMGDKPKVVRCSRCGKRHRNQPEWNRTWIAGIEVGMLCPDCQTTQEDLEARVNEVLDPPSQHKTINDIEGSDSPVVKAILALARSYPTPEIMRYKADLLAAARKDPQASEIVRLMQTVADAMESGELDEDDESTD